MANFANCKVFSMKIKIIRDYDYRLAPARIQAFRAGNEVSVPKKTADALIGAGVAIAAVAAETETADKE